MEFRLLRGPIEAVRDDRTRSRWEARSRGRCSLSSLLHANEVVSRDRLIERAPGPAGRPAPPSTASTSRSRGSGRAFAPDDLLLTRSGGYAPRGRARRGRRGSVRAVARRGPACECRRRARRRPAVARGCSRALARAGAGRGRLRGLRAAPTRSGSRSSGSSRSRSGSTAELDARPARHADRRARSLDRDAPPARAAARRSSCSRSTAPGGRRRRCACTRRRARSSSRSSGSSLARRSASSSRRILRAGSGARAPARRARRAGAAACSWAQARSCWQPPPWRSSWASPRAPPRARTLSPQPDSDVFVDAGSGEARAGRARPRHGAARVRRRRPLEHLVDR